MKEDSFSVKENSWLAHIAAKKLRSPQVAMVLGKTIHLHKITKEEFLGNERWLNHELCHIRQFRYYGHWGFMVRYLLESIRRGYYNNMFEVAARAAETS